MEVGLYEPLRIEFSGKIWHWRGPSPYYFVTAPAEQCSKLKGVARRATYGWGMIPATVRIGATEWKTSLFPKGGGYVVPLKDSVRRAEHLDVGDTVTLILEVR